MAIDQLRAELVAQHTDETETRVGRRVDRRALTKMKSSCTVNNLLRSEVHIYERPSKFVACYADREKWS
jgi:hypothetical protein